MSALRWGQESRNAAGDRPSRGVFPSFERFVLPRWLRRPVRLFTHLGNGDFAAPPFSAAALSAVLLASSATYGGYVGGHLDGFVQDVTARTGFAVDQIKVVGNVQTSEIDVLDKLDLNGWTSLIGFDVEAARERIAALPWVEGAAVRKVYPHTLEVHVEEREPFAIWQQGRELSVIERSGRIIGPYSGGRQAALPLLVGAGAPEGAPAMMAKIGRYPDFAARVRGYIRVGDRRWDLRLDNGVTVKLPEDGEDAAIAALVGMDRDSGLLERDIVAVDMRIPDRLALQLSPEAASAREAALKAKPGIAKPKLERKI